MYGLNNRAPLSVLAGMVTDVLGNGKNNTASNLLIETACAETQAGTFRDLTPNGAGRGVCQADEIGFIDVVERTRSKDKNLVLFQLGYDLNKIRHEDLNEDPLLALIICRLHYKLRPEEIPVSVVDRAIYWKRFYNTKAGKGTPEHYLESVEKYQREKSHHA